MTLATKRSDVRRRHGILPGTPHRIRNTGAIRGILCACSPAYSHDDTELL
jgi:hypothetical protein